MKRFIILPASLFTLMLSASWVTAESGSWTGDGANDFWNNNANWSGATYPGAEAGDPNAFPDDPDVPGDRAILPNLGVDQFIDLNGQTIVLQQRSNDAPSPAQAAIEMSSGTAHNYTIGGNGTLEIHSLGSPSVVPGHIDNNGSGVLTFGSGVAIEIHNINFSSRNFRGNGRIDILGTVLSTNGPLTLRTGAGAVRFAGTGAQLLSDVLAVATKTLEVVNPDAFGSLSDARRVDLTADSIIRAVEGNNRINVAQLRVGNSNPLIAPRIGSDLIVTNELWTQAGSGNTLYTSFDEGTTTLVEGRISGNFSGIFGKIGEGTLRWENDLPPVAAGTNDFRMGARILGGTMVFNVEVFQRDFVFEVGTLLDGDNNFVSSGTLAGNGIVSHPVHITSSQGRILAGDHDVFEAQTLTLSNGLAVDDGASFSFRLGGTDGATDLLSISGGNPENLLGNLTVDFFDLGLSSVEAGVGYTILLWEEGDFSQTLGQWQIGATPDGWSGGVFSSTGDDLIITFGVIPEPTTSALLLGLSAIGLALRRHWSRRRLLKKE